MSTLLFSDYYYVGAKDRRSEGVPLTAEMLSWPVCYSGRTDALPEERISLYQNMLRAMFEFNQQFEFQVSLEVNEQAHVLQATKYGWTEITFGSLIIDNFCNHQYPLACWPDQRGASLDAAESWNEKDWNGFFSSLIRSYMDVNHKMAKKELKSAWSNLFASIKRRIQVDQLARKLRKALS